MIDWTITKMIVQPHSPQNPRRSSRTGTRLRAGLSSVAIASPGARHMTKIPARTHAGQRVWDCPLRADGMGRARYRT